MKSHLIQIGNSKGIRLPKSMIEECNLEKDIEIVIQRKNIVIRPLKKIRAHWDEDFKKMACENDDELLMDISDAEEEWEW